MSNSPVSVRRYDLDWLRVIAFFLLIYYHTAILFTPGGIPMIQNSDTSELLSLLADFLHEFRLALLFLISGVGIAFARRRRSEREFLKERSVRLLIPMIFGIAVIVPPMIYLEKLFLNTFEGSFVSFYADFYTEGVYPKGHLSWHHFWFIAYLYLYCLMGQPLFRHLDSEDGKKEIVWIENHRHGFRLYAYILPLVIIEIALRALFHGVPDLIHDWANYFHYFMILLAGYVFCSSEPLLDQTETLRWRSLLLAIMTAGLLFYFFRMPEGGFAPGPVISAITIPEYLTFCLVRIANIWFWLMTILGWSSRYLRFSTPLLGYLNQAVYPLFILHLTVITTLGYLAVTWQADLWIKYMFITTGTILLCLALYQTVIKPFSLMQLCFGVKKL